MTDSLYIAVDLGAGSGRVFLTGLAPGELLLREVRRFQYPPAFTDGHLRWDIRQIFAEIKTGLRAAQEAAEALHRPVQSVGVDSWGVDYGLIDSAGKLIEDPVCYRDERTRDTMQEVFARVPPAEIYGRTGIQFLEFNTLFQLFAHSAEGIPRNAARMLLIPDLINFLLTGQACNEFTNATTTQLVAARGGSWDRELIARLNLPERLFAEIVPGGTNLGRLRPAIVNEIGLGQVDVVAPATHDTGSAVAGTPLTDGWAYISSGTWSLVGIERSQPLIDDEVGRHNFTNEGGALSTVRFLKNVMGLWILDSCRREWDDREDSSDYDSLLREVAALQDCPGIIFPDDQRLFNPPSMLRAIAQQLQETGQEMAGAPAQVAKTILDSLAFRYASVLRAIEALTGTHILGVHIIGGGSRNDYLNQATADATGMPVCAGPVEATVIGNSLVQAISAGRFESLGDARQHLAANLQLTSFQPRVSKWIEAARRRYAGIEQQYEQKRIKSVRSEFSAA